MPEGGRRRRPPSASYPRSLPKIPIRLALLQEMWLRTVRRARRTPMSFTRLSSRKGTATAFGSLIVLTLVGTLTTAPTLAGASPRSAHAGYPMRAWPLSPHGPVLPTNGQWFGAHVAIDPTWTGATRQEAQLNGEASIGRKFQLDRQYYTWREPWPTADDYWSRDQGRILM